MPNIEGHLNGQARAYYVFLVLSRNRASRPMAKSETSESIIDRAPNDRANERKSSLPLGSGEHSAAHVARSLMMRHSPVQCGPINCSSQSNVSVKCWAVHLCLELSAHNFSIVIDKTTERSIAPYCRAQNGRGSGV